MEPAESLGFLDKRRAPSSLCVPAEGIADHHPPWVADHRSLLALRIALNFPGNEHLVGTRRNAILLLTNYLGEFAAGQPVGRLLQSRDNLLGHGHGLLPGKSLRTSASC